jgi:choice-of-anchor B domain-containing protein
MKYLSVFFIIIIFSFSLLSNESKNIKLLSNWQDSSLAPPNNTESAPSFYNEVWGYASGGREYAIMGSSKGTYIIDITDPNNPYQADYIKGRGDDAIRDYHTYKNYLYMVADGYPGALMIADLSFLPDSVSLIYDSIELIENAHNIFIDTVSARLYSTRGQILSLENPELPKLIGTFAIAGAGTHDYYVRADTVYLFENASDYFYIWDARDVDNIENILTLSNYPDRDFCHSGWLSEDGNIFVLSNEFSGAKMKLYNVEDKSYPKLISTFRSNVSEKSVPHNQIMKGNYIFVSYYEDGLCIFDISNPANPVMSGFYDTNEAETEGKLRGAWGVYPFLPSGNVIVSDRQTGLYIFDVSEAVNPLSVESSQSEPEIKLFPNPFDNLLQIKFMDDDVPRNFTLELISISGQKIADFEINNNNSQIFSQDISEKNIPRGIYIVKIKTENKTWVIKANH